MKPTTCFRSYYTWCTVLPNHSPYQPKYYFSIQFRSHSSLLTNGLGPHNNPNVLTWSCFGLLLERKVSHLATNSNSVCGAEMVISNWDVPSTKMVQAIWHMGSLRECFWQECMVSRQWWLSTVEGCWLRQQLRYYQYSSWLVCDMKLVVVSICHIGATSSHTKSRFAVRGHQYSTYGIFEVGSGKQWREARARKQPSRVACAKTMGSNKVESNESKNPPHDTKRFERKTVTMMSVLSMTPTSSQGSKSFDLSLYSWFADNPTCHATMLLSLDGTPMC